MSEVKKAEQVQETSISVEKSELIPSREAAANWFSLLSFNYLNPLFETGVSTSLEQTDVPDVYPGDDAEECYNSFMEEWEQEKLQEHPSLFRSLRRTIGRDWWVTVVLKLINVLCNFAPAAILNILVRWLDGDLDLSVTARWLVAASIVVIPLLGSICFNHHQHLVNRIGYRARAAMTTAVFRKSLKISSTSRSATSVGVIVNIMSTDAQKLREVCLSLNSAWASPIIIAFALYLLYQQIGEATFAGFGFLFFMMPFNGLVFAKMAQYQGQIARLADTRIKLTNEVLLGMKVVKMYAWEIAFHGRISKVRDEELHILKKYAYLLAFGFLTLLLCAPFAMRVIVFVTYTKLGNNLDAATAFTSLVLFQILTWPFSFLPLVLQSVAEANISLTRLSKFLQLAEIDDSARVLVEGGAVEDGEEIASITNGSFQWLVDAEGTAELKALAATRGRRGRAPSPQKEEAEGNRKKAEEKGSELMEIVTVEDEGGDAAAEADADADADEDSKASDASAVVKAPFMLQDINVSIKKGELVAVVGSVGSGKSSFINALLGEMPCLSGSITCAKTVSYAAQEPWILNQTLRNNIHFNLETDLKEDHYAAVTQACALRPDFEQLPAGDLTEIGERGINLSGGQRARVSLARAVYNDADIYVFDDPLSAVDAHVASHIFEHVLLGCLKNETRLLVTNQLQFLKDVDRIIFLKKGADGVVSFISEQGSFDELMANGSSFAELMNKHSSTNEGTDSDDGQSVDKSTGHCADASPEKLGGVANSNSPKKRPSKAKADASQADKSDADLKKEGALVEKEERKKGDISAEHYWYYIKMFGPFIFYTLAAFYLFTGASGVLTAFWLAEWADEAEANPDYDVDWYIFIYGMLGVGACLLVALRSYLFARGRVNASQELHSRLLSQVLSARMRFFDTNPIGRILNRFSSDVNVIDVTLPPSLGRAAHTISEVVFALLAVVLSTKGLFLPALLPVGLLYTYVQRWFRLTSTELQRLSSISKSPIYAHFSETLAGLSTIRVLSAQGASCAKNVSSVNRATRNEFTYQAIGNWLALRLDILGQLLSFSIVLMVILDSSLLSAEFAGIALSYSLTIPAFFKMAVQQRIESESKMNAVERLRHYETIASEHYRGVPAPADKLAEEKAETEEGEGGISEHDEGEKASIFDAGAGNKGWLCAGQISLENVTVEYERNKPVLKDLSLDIRSGEKIGVVGRTGSGKSTLMLALLRILEAKAGRIKIDGTDISQISLHSLRSDVAIIPQEPMLFSTSIRANLDPFDQYTDERIWEVLEQVQLKAYVQTLDRELETEIAEGGSNFSVGQRQLICIGRALLRNPRLLLLDEATASIDVDTDMLMQRMIRENFKDATVITIAHRLKTIMDSDRIVLLEKGRLADPILPPLELMDDRDTEFSKLVHANGAEYAESLRKIAVEGIDAMALSPDASYEQDEKSIDVSAVTFHETKQ